ncbi:uncharacterized protein N7496_009468 [Penicillium cataractarum]|uniref:C2H2-type domain-containing protein n=1 Tax=Penicillium cataractarum TaxID=2100454 RepID=A0A9W9RP09_9EURO|nr:uncharacterized protein N7496_009468 [Penicillium cataractarum]KAJ5363755.1 hypothetical protein N7496_009468 [Penicillium cataractarum]
MRAGYDPPSRGNDYVPSPNDIMIRHERKQRNEETRLWSQTVQGAADIEADDDDATSNTADYPLRPEDYFSLGFHRTIHSIPGPGVMIHESSDDGMISEDETGWSTASDSLPAIPDEHRVDNFSTAGADPSWKSTASSSQPSQILPGRDTLHDNMHREASVQPESSYAAMAAFQRRAEELDTASITATIDNDSVNNVILQLEQSLNITNTFKELSTARSHLMHGVYQESPIPTNQAPDPFFGRATDTTQQADVEGEPSSGNSFRQSNELIRSPSLDDMLSPMSEQIVLPKVQTSPPRTRSQSQSEMPWSATHGGAHSSNIKLEMDAEPSPGSIAPGIEKWRTDENDKLEVAEEKGFVKELSRVLPKPTLEGFEAHIAQINPRMTAILIHRFTQEQLLRYRKLIERQQQHMAAVEKGSCKSGELCFGSGGQALLLTRRKGTTDVWNDHNHDQSYLPNEGAISPDQFPGNIPLPPVSKLPAVFECPICFQVKTIHKPSDWSRHILEDLQLYMCTFPDCTGPWFFKRKASWVRHESERHRRLRWWTCSYPGCIYTCTRRSAFIHHVLREHDMLEPKGSVPDSGASKEVDRLSKLVEECKHETSSTLVNEPCRFCGNIFPTWKKLTGHLGMHMEQLALPVLELVQQACASAS